LATEYPSHGSDSWDENDRKAKKPVYLELVEKLKETLTVVEGYSGELKDAGAIAIADRVLAEGMFQPRCIGLTLRSIRSL
jgi:hypothetical protein